VAFALAGTLAAQVALAETQAEIAEKENDDGRALMFQGNYKGATEKFRDAADRAPEAKYFFNLCSSVYAQGIFGEAITACNNADKLNPDDTLKGKLSKLEDKIKSDAAAQHIDLQPTGGGGGPTNVDPNAGTGTPPPDGNGGNNGTPPPDGNGGNNGNGGTGGTTVAGGGPVTAGAGGAQLQYAVGRPSQDIMAMTPPEHNYTWTLGVDFFGGGGRIGQPNFYGSSSVGIRVKADYMLIPQLKVGAEGYLQYQHFGQGNNANDTAMATLDIFDLGVAAYKHFCIAQSRLCLTPLAGVQLALMSPANESDGEGSQVFNYAAVGGRLEVALQYALGRRLEHVISIAAGANLYSPVLSSPTDGSGLGTASEIGLDAGGVAGYLSLGYTFRFDTPLGSAPFITLE
jgi:tetratricopeptide (TPR) repeat protein